MRLNRLIFFALLLGIVNFLNAQTFTWTGSTNSNWTDESNWDDGDGFTAGDGYPDGSSDAAIIPNVSRNPIINATGIICGALTIQSSGSLTCSNVSNSLTATTIDLQSGGQLAITNGEVTSNGNFTHAGVLTLSAGTLDINGNYTSSGNVTANISGGTIEISGDWDGTSGSGFDPSGGTVFFNRGSAQSISTHASNYFHDLTFGGGVKTNTVGSDLVVNGDLLISTGTLDMAADANTLDVGGNFTLSGVSFIPYAGVHDIAGNWDDSGSGNAGFAPTAGKIILSGASSTITTKSDNKFFNLEIDKSSATATCNSDLTVGGVLDFEDGTLDIAANTLFPEGNLIRNTGTISGSSGGAIHYGTAGTYDICAFSDNDILIKLLGSASGAINLTTTGNIDCNKIWLNKSTHVFLVDGETINVSDEINIQSGKFQITSGTVNINSNEYNDIHLQASTSYLDIDGGTVNVGNNSNSSSGIEMADGTLDLSSGTLNIDHNIKIDAGTVSQSGGTISVKHYVGDFDGVKKKFLMSSGTLNLTAGTLRLNGQNADGVNAATYPAIDIASGVTVNANANHVILVQSNNSSSNDEDMYLDFNGNTIGDLTINLDGHTVFHQTDVNLLGDLTLTAGSLDFGSTSVDVAGNWNDSGNDGGFTPSAGTVTLSGSGTTITTGSNNNFFNLTSTGDKTVQSELDINGNLTVSSGNFKLLTNECTVSGTTDVDGSLTISSGTFTANGPSDISGVLTITTSGIYDANGTFTASGGNIAFSVGSTGFLKLNNTVTALGTLTQTAGTVVYDGASTQSIVTDNYFNLTIDQSGIKQALGTLDINGDLTVSNGAVFDINFNNADVAGNWNDAGGTFQAGDGVVTFSGSGKTVTTGGSNYFAGLTINSLGTITAQSELDINGAFEISSGTFDINGQNADVAGYWNDASGTFQATGGTVTLSGATTHTTGGSNYFYGLTISGSGTNATSTDLDINGDFTISSGTFSPGSNGVEVAGNWSNSATFTPGTGTVTFDGSGAQTISGTNTFYDLTINNAHASLKVSANGSTLTVQDDLLISDGIFESASDYHDVTISGGATLELTGNITVSGNWSNSGTFTPNTNLVTFDGGAAQSLTSGGSSFYDLSTATSNTDLTIQDALVVSNDLTIAASTTLDAGTNQAISVGGDWTNNGTFTSASGTVTFNGSGAQTVTTGGVGTGNDFNNVTITNTGTLADGSDVETSGAIKVNGTLDVTDGQFMPAASSDFVNVTLSSSNGKIKQSGLGTITVSGTWNNSGGSSSSFEGNFGTVSFDGTGAQSLTSGGISFYNLSTSTASTDLTIQDALIVSNNLTIGASTTLDAGSNQAISVGRNWDNGNGGTFTSASGTVTFNGSSNQTITTGGVGTGNDFYNLTIANTGSPADPLDVETSGAIKVTGTLDVTDGQFMPATSSEFLDVTVSASGGILKPASSSSITVSGNWSDASGDFTPNSGTVIMDGTSKTIATGASNEFYNLTISGSVTTSTSNDVEVEGTLTVSGSLTVSPGDELTLEDATISGTLTVDADGSNDATLDFSEADNPVFGITGTLRLDGEDASNRAIVSGDGDSRIDFDITGTGVLNADYFTFHYPNTDGLNITGSGTQVLSYGAFDYPANSGTLLNISAATDLPDELTGFSFGNTGPSPASSPKNVTADGTTDLVTFTSYSGALASDASTAETNETDASNKVYWFDNLWYSSGNQTPTDNTKWWSTNGGSGLNPTNFTNASHKFLVQSGDTYTATGDWTVAGEVEVDGALVTGGNTITMAGKTDVDGTLTISNGGVYDANGEFDATGGTIDQDGTSALRMSGTVTSLGSSLDNAAGTVEYDGGAQDVFADNYYNLVIDQSGDKTATGGSINVANDMTISNSATFRTGSNHITITGATTVSATLVIGNAQFNCYGGFSATGAINFSNTGGKLNFFTVSPTSLGTLDNTRGTVDYELGATDVLADDYYALRIMGGGTAKTLQGDVNVADELFINSGSELNLGNNTITVTGLSDINGVLDFNNGGTFDANGTFNATNGTVQFTGVGGSLKLGGATVTSLGNTLTEGTGTIEYDYAGNQTVISETYYNLNINNATGVKTAGGDLDIDGDLTVSAGELAMTTSSADVATGKTVNIDGTLSITTGTFTANGSTSDIDGTLTINGAGIYDADGTFDATSGTVEFTGSGGTLKLGGATVTSIGNIFTKGTGTVEYDYAGNQSVKARNYYNLEIDGSSTSDVKSVINNFTIDNNLTVSSTSAFDVLARTITVTGASDINGILNINGSGILDANGSFDATSGSITMDGTARLQLNSTVTSLGTLDDAAGTVEYDQAGTQTILSAPTYYDLEIDGSGSKRTDGNTSTNGDVTITAGTLDLDNGNDNLTIGGDFINSGTLDATNQTITFSGSTQNTSSLINDNTVDLVVNKSSTGGITFQGNSAFDEVTISDGYLDIGAYTFTAANTISIASDGTLKIPNSGTFNADGQLSSSGTIDFTGSGSQGDLICSSTSANTFGTLDAAAGTVTFDGSGSQAIPVETFFNLKNSNTNGLTMSGNATVNGELNLNVAADITTGANTLTIGTGGSITNAADDRHINVDNTSGFLAKSTNSTSAFSFPVGNGTIVRPIRLTPSSTSAETYTVRYDDNRYSDGSVTSAFSNTGGHISGYDNEDQAPNSAASGYYYDISRSNSVNAVLYIEWTNVGQYGTGGNVLNADVTGITFGYYNGSDWDVITSSPTGSISNGNVTSNAFNFAGQYVTLGSLDGENNLPIDLVYFEGECVDNQVNLEFVVASQVNNEYFTIERSKNLLSWEKLGDIVGGGTNNEEITYNFKDISPNSGDNYYRLSQTDIDGTTESFSPIAVTCESKVENYHIYPNPTTNRIAVEFELEFYQGDDIELVIRDFKGSIVKSNSIDLNRGYNYFEVDLSDIPNGIYMISYSGTKNHIPLKRVIKL